MAQPAVKRPVGNSRERNLRLVPGFGGGSPPPGPRSLRLANAQIGVLLLIASETTMFAGLLAAHFVLRSGSAAWPPPNLPRLPLAITCVNSGMLMLSAFTVHRALSAARYGRQQGLMAALLATVVLGMAFVVVQGTEWVRLIRQGLTLSSGLYGATFYTIIGLHAVHVVAAVIWLSLVLRSARRGRYIASNHVGVWVCAVYWYFVCVLWLVLVGAIYLN
ncbi:MAG: heme-copper oxidase subunit III [Deltaproteobacteria bacterium]|nr:heme-copper oxidase subunit III [Deltaproteobacteria bacterium]